MKAIYFIEKNIRGAWAVFGILGVRQYYGYTKKEAEQLYKEEASKKIFINR